MPQETIKGWRGQQIVGARSRGSRVFAAFDWRDLVLMPEPPIEKKAATPSRQAWSFAEEDRARLAERDGRYTDLQSVNSEDSVTWATFGPAVKDRAVHAVVRAAFPSSHSPSSLTRAFWQRYPHPEGGRRKKGPEPDVVLGAVDWCLVTEAKWRADLDGKQGRGGGTGQLEMRTHVAQQSAPAGFRGVLVVVPSPRRYLKTKRHPVFARYFAPEGDTYRALPACDELATRMEVPIAVVTWEQIVEILAGHGTDRDVVAYLRWRLGHLG